jgi:hypothetical protein
VFDLTQHVAKNHSFSNGRNQKNSKSFHDAQGCLVSSLTLGFELDLSARLMDTARKVDFLRISLEGSLSARGARR